MSSAKRIGEKEPRHVRLYHWLMDTPAWRDLDPVCRCVYIEIVRRYGGPGSNNGRIPCWLEELKRALHIGKSTAQRALAELQEHGFLVLASPGGFNIKHRHSTEWLLTEFRDDRQGAGVALHSKAFARWQKTKRGSQIEPHRVSDRTRSGPVAGQSQPVTMADGSYVGPVAEYDGSYLGPRIVYQGEGDAATTGTAQPAEEARPSKAGAPRSGQADGFVHVSDALANSRLFRASGKGAGS